MISYICSVLLILCLSQAQAYIITVDAHAEECFFEKVEAGTRLGIKSLFF